MLARSFKTASELGVSEIEYSALLTTLFAFERGEITNFTMDRFRHACGTPACICGWANHLSGGEAFPELDTPSAGRSLFDRLPQNLLVLFDIGYPKNDAATIEQAQRALSSYLTTGEPNWVEATA